MDLLFYLGITLKAAANGLAAVAVFMVSSIMLSSIVGDKPLNLIQQGGDEGFMKDKTAQLLQVTIFTLVFMFSWLLRAGVGR